MGEVANGITGERARLFPVLAERSKEGRATSVFLACLEHVHEFGAALLGTLGQRVGTRAQIRAYTEVKAKRHRNERAPRPDGFIELTVWKRTWSALVETKVGNAALQASQVEEYLAFAADHDVDALITISNDFTLSPAIHPLGIKPRSKKVALFHWSWMTILTEADLLVSNDDVEDVDQQYVLAELKRFLGHDSTGVKGFVEMPPAWKEVAAGLRAGATLRKSAGDTQEVVLAWHQETRDLALILSRQTGVEVAIRMPRAHRGDPSLRSKADVDQLCDTGTLLASFDVPDAAAPLEVTADFAHRSLVASMTLRAPEDRKSTQARVNWLLRQLSDMEDEGMHVRLHYPGRTPPAQFALADLRADVALVDDVNEGKQVTRFEVLKVETLGARFAQRKTIIVDLENLVPDFYRDVGANLKAWQAKAPRMRKGREEPEQVTPHALGQNDDHRERPHPDEHRRSQAGQTDADGR